MAKRLIDANELDNKLRDYEFSMLCPLDEVDDVIDCCHTVDAVEVVRCRECRYYFHYGKTSISKNVKAGWCQRRTRCDEEIRMAADDFCSYGERRR